jgi:F-type H+-transporting ATPase subunit epsilon
MASSFQVEVLTPEGQVFADEVELVSTRTTTGSIGIKARHAPLMAILEPTELRLYKSDSDVVRFAQGEGYLQVVNNQALVKEAQQALERAEDDSEEKARAEREVKRYEAFLEVGQS